eukprot:1434978-Amphidinium_carterae.1
MGVAAAAVAAAACGASIRTDKSSESNAASKSASAIEPPLRSESRPRSQREFLQQLPETVV